MTDSPMEISARAAPSLRLPSSRLVLSAAVLACLGLLSLPLVLPLGPMYWDLVLYLDAAHRIAQGQAPLVDFLTPVGPLGYWLFFGLDRLFPRAHPLLVAQWCVLAVTVPPLWFVLREAERRSWALAWGLLLPFLLFQLVPVNVEQYSFFPGFDGYGIYNRHASIVLYVLVAGLVFVRERRVLAFILAWTLLALLLIKVTGFLAGGLICAAALLMGRLDLRIAAIVAGLIAAGLALLEVSTGLVGLYAGSIRDLIAINAGGILPRFLQAASLHLDIVGGGLALLSTLLILSRHDLANALARLSRERSASALSALVDREPFRLGVVLAAGLFVETQNTGGQAFIFAWPVLLMILWNWSGRQGKAAFLVLALVAATAIPPAATVMHRAGRSLLAQSGYVALPNAHLGSLGRVSQHPDVIARAMTMKRIYASARATYGAIAAAGQLPTYSLYSELDFQAGWLMALDLGVAAILDHEAETGRRFTTIMTLNFANPFPALMGREGVRHIAIGADPYRAVPEPGPAARAAVMAADLILKPQCPITSANNALLTIYEPAMAGRREIALGPCWKGYVKRPG